MDESFVTYFIEQRTLAADFLTNWQLIDPRQSLDHTRLDQFWFLSGLIACRLLRSRGSCYCSIAIDINNVDGRKLLHV